LFFHVLSSYDPDFTTPKTENRGKYYSPGQSYPFLRIDGLLSTVCEYSTVKQYVDQRKSITAPVSIVTTSSCPDMSGKATVKVTNKSNATIDGTLQFVINERNIKYSWSSMTYVDAVRDMIPDEKGEPVSIPAGQSITKNRDFTINSKWNKTNCEIVVFLQLSKYEIVEGCVSALNSVSPIINKPDYNENRIKVKITPKAIMLYVPNSEKSNVVFNDVKGKEITSFTLNKSNEWLCLPEIKYNGLVIMHVKTANNDYYKKIWIVK